MARKPVLEGGKRDEIIAAAAQLFFTEGFEKTSVRKILDKVGGEVGMFYHYFKSKDELFDVVADSFFRQYEASFRMMADNTDSVEDLVDRFMDLYETAMGKYAMIKDNMHWTIRCALHERTLAALVPTAELLLQRFGYHGRYPLDIAAARVIADISAAIHSASFEKMDEAERKQLLISLVSDAVKA